MPTEETAVEVVEETPEMQATAELNIEEGTCTYYFYSNHKCFLFAVADEDFLSDIDQEEENVDVMELQRQLNKYKKRLCHKLYAEVEVLRRIPKSVAVYNVLKDKDVWKVT